LFARLVLHLLLARLVPLVLHLLLARLVPFALHHLLVRLARLVPFVAEALHLAAVKC
jgi:hypothetical protein